MADVLKIVLAAVGGIATFAVALAFLCRSLVQHWFAKALSEHSNSIQLARDKAVKAFSVDLEVEARKHGTQFDRLHAERTKIIIELHRAIVTSRSSLRHFTNPVQMGVADYDAMARQSVLDYRQMHNLIIDADLFFDNAVCEALRKLDENISQLVSRADNVYRLGKIPGSNITMGKLHELCPLIDTQVEPQERVVVSHFKKLLGVRHE